MGASRLLTFLFHGLAFVSLALNLILVYHGDISISTHFHTPVCPK